jgi:hypothetical protein
VWHCSVPIFFEKIVFSPLKCLSSFRERPSTNIEIDRLELEKGQKFSLHYDYGDGWMFTINVQKIEETDWDGKVNIDPIQGRGGTVSIFGRLG